ncbi:MAG: alcohol dehydrogenase catalytic domain-containing protein, partial [Candidatus Dormibacteria bacterium]
MRAALIEALAGAPRVTEVPDPSPGPGQALIRVEAAGLNPVDVSVASGRHYSRVPDPPYVPGIEGAGRVLQGQRLPPGARVRFETGPASGSLAELAAVDEDRCLQVELDAPTAAGFGVAGSAAW